MIRATLQQLQSVISGAVLHGADGVPITFEGLSTDSRKIAAPQVFLALRGEHFDAHNFLLDVEKAGAVAVIAEQVPEQLQIPALIVPDTKLALQKIAAFWRSQWAIPVIGVTGSNGKTTVKEMIATILATQFGEENRIATQGNLNNEIGVPLTLMRLGAQHRAAVIEMGMNHPGEIAVLAQAAQPTVALVNNAQREHQEFMQSVEAVALENAAVFQSLGTQGTAVFPANDTYSDLWRKLAQEAGAIRILSFGLSSDADVSAQFDMRDFGSLMTLNVDGQSHSIRLQAAGQHNVLNALAAAACCFAIGVSVEKIVQGLELFLPVSGRLQLKPAASGARVIDDTYNANPDSVKAAIDVLAASSGETTLVLGDMGEVGNEGAAFHQEIGTYARDKGVQYLFSFGSLARASSDAFGAGAQHDSELDDLLHHLSARNHAGQTILVKGSRFMKMERVVNALLTTTEK